MEIIWIIGVGKFGAAAAKRLSQQHKNWQFVLVDPVKENLLKAKGVNMAIEQTDGIGFLNKRLEPGAQVSWIIPSLPVHLVWEWCYKKLGPTRLVRTRLPLQTENLLPNVMRGTNGDVYASNADFVCPSNCSEPEDVCTVTGQPRKQDMFRRFEHLGHGTCASMVLRSRQLGPGIGGYSPQDLFSILKKIQAHRGDLLVCTACRCHGVVTSARRI